MSNTIELKGSGDHRCYMSEYGIPTIQLGCGGTIISDLVYPDEILSGVGFSLGSGGVGDDKPEIRGKGVAEIGVFFQVITDNPASLQVLIDKLTLAKTALVKKLNTE